MASEHFFHNDHLSWDEKAGSFQRAEKLFIRCKQSSLFSQMLIEVVQQQSSLQITRTIPFATHHVA